MGSSALSAVISGIFNVYQASKNQDTVEQKALQLLLLDNIKRSAREYISQGSVATEELESFTELYNTYKALGGNGFAEAIYKKVNSLPIQERQ